MNCLGGFENIQLVLPFCNGYQMGGVPVVFQVSKKDNINATSEPLFCPCAPLSMVQRISGPPVSRWKPWVLCWFHICLFVSNDILYGILHIVRYLTYCTYDRWCSCRVSLAHWFLFVAYDVLWMQSSLHLQVVHVLGRGCTGCLCQSEASQECPSSEYFDYNHHYNWSVKSLGWTSVGCGGCLHWSEA